MCFAWAAAPLSKGSDELEFYSRKEIASARFFYLLFRRTRYSVCR
jgi:hypothetical protein